LDTPRRGRREDTELELAKAPLAELAQRGGTTTKFMGDILAFALGIDAGRKCSRGNQQENLLVDEKFFCLF